MNLELLKNKKSKVVSAAALLPFTFFLTSCGLGANKASTQKEAAPKEETKKEAPQTVVVQQQEVAQTATPPASANTAEEYAQLLYKKEKLAAWLQKFETTTAKEKKNYFEELERLVEQVQELKKAFEKHEAMRGELTKLKRVMENAQQEVNIAGAYNYTLGKEVVLYLFTLKPI